MPSKIQILRTFTTTAGTSPSQIGAAEGELAVNLTGNQKPALFVFGGNTATGTAPSNRGWVQINPDPAISVTRWDIAGTSASPSTDANNQALNPTARTVAAGEIVIAVHNGVAYAFTGGTGRWGAPAIGGTPVPTVTSTGQFVSLGSSVSDPQILDWSARTEANPGAAYNAWHSGAGTPDYTGDVVFIKWKDGQVYLLTDSANPGDGTKYIPVSQAVTTEVIDWTGLTPVPADTGAAYTTWHAGTGTPDFKAAVSIVKFKGQFWLLTDPKTPGDKASYSAISMPVPAALTFRGNIDVQAAMPANHLNTWAVGDFGILANTAGGAVGTPITPDGTWPLTGAAGYEVGDLAIYDGTSLHVLPQDSNLASYLPLAGGTMSDGAGIIFDTTSARTLPNPGTAPGAASVTVIDGNGGTVDNVVIDGGTY
jgi:hypothetical protein